MLSKERQQQITRSGCCDMAASKRAPLKMQPSMTKWSSRGSWEKKKIDVSLEALSFTGLLYWFWVHLQCSPILSDYLQIAYFLHLRLLAVTNIWELVCQQNARRWRYILEKDYDSWQLFFLFCFYFFFLPIWNKVLLLLKAL